MTINADSILAGMQPFIPFGKGAQTAEGAGTFHSLWKAGGYPAAGATPPAFNTSGYVPTRTTQGALPINNPASGNAYPAHLNCGGPTDGMLFIYDRVWACSGFSANVTTLQTVTNQSDAGRYSTFDGIELWLEVYGAPGTTGGNWTLNYTNQANTGSRQATYVKPANAESVGQMMPVALQAGDTGVRSFQGLQLGTASGAGGDIGVTLLKRICAIPISIRGTVMDAFQLGMERVLDDACLAMQVLCSTTSTGMVMGMFKPTHVVP